MRSGFMFGLAKAIMSPIYAVLFPHRAIGVENLPAQGGFVLCVNHIHARDPFFLSTVIPTGKKLFFMAKKELFKSKIVGTFLSWLGAFPVDRGHADLNSIRTSMKVVREGNGLVIFPQGTRSKTNAPTPFLSGASMIALRGGVPVIPCYIAGPYRLFRHSDIHFGAPLDLSAHGTRCDQNTLESATKQIEGAVWALREPDANDT